MCFVLWSVPWKCCKNASPQILKFLAHKPPNWKIFSSQAPNLEIFSSQAPFSEATISTQAPHFGNPGRTPLPEKKVDEAPPPVLYYICLNREIQYSKLLHGLILLSYVLLELTTLITRNKQSNMPASMSCYISLFRPFYYCSSTRYLWKKMAKFYIYFVVLFSWDHEMFTLKCNVHVKYSFNRLRVQLQRCIIWKHYFRWFSEATFSKHFIDAILWIHRDVAISQSIDFPHDLAIWKWLVMPLSLGLDRNQKLFSAKTKIWRDSCISKREMDVWMVGWMYVKKMSTFFNWL